MSSNAAAKRGRLARSARSDAYGDASIKITATNRGAAISAEN